MIFLFRFGAILVLYQNYQERIYKHGDSWLDDSGGNHKGVEIGSIYGKTIGPVNGNNQPVAAGMIGGGRIYGTHHHIKGTSSGSVLSHTGSNNNVSTGGL